MVSLKKSRSLYQVLIAFLIFWFIVNGPSLKTTAAISMTNIPQNDSGNFVEINQKWYYRLQDGSYAKNCTLSIHGKVYCFNKKGVRLSGWKKIKKNYYYFGDRNEGYMYCSKWIKSKSGARYYLMKDGKTATGLVKIKKKNYYFDKRGKRQYGWKKVDGKKYYFGTPDEGYMYQNTFLKYKNHLYYLNNEGLKATGWQTINNERYYFNKKGYAYTGTHKIKGIKYTFSSSGILQQTNAKINVNSDCAILINAKTGEVLYEKNADQQHANASTTKIMTCILALEKGKMSDIVTASAKAVKQEPTKLYMNVGEQFVMKDLLYSLMLPSHNDTAVAIAEHISGSTNKFVKVMNRKAVKLGCTNTNFVTPNGLDNNGKKQYAHYTTARDMAKIARYAYQNAIFREIVQTPYYSFMSKQGNSYYVTTTNSLLGTLEGVTGMKTGYTNKAGYCFVGSIKNKKGNEFIAVVLGGSSSTERWEDARTMLKYAYSS